MNKNKSLQISYAFLAAALTVPIVLLIFWVAGRLPGGDWIFMHSDFRVQYAAFAKLFWRSLLRGEGIDYTFHVSLGMPSIPLYTFYSLSPFNILYILIDHVELASVVLVVLKLSLAAYTFQRFSVKVLKNDSISSVAFAVAYALSGYCLMFYFNILYLDGVYMLPVIAMLIADLVKEGRCIKLALAYAYVFVTQFYEGYIIGFFSLLFFVLLMITECKKEWKKYVNVLVRFVISVVIAALIGAAFLYPTAAFLLVNHGSREIADWTFDCHIWDIYKNLFIGQNQGIGSSYPYIYCGIMVLCLVPCFFADKRVKKEHKLIALILLGYLLLCSLWLPGYRFMHCFDVPDGFQFRFAYFYSFVLLAIGCVEWKYMESKNPRKLALLFMIQIAGYFIVCLGTENIAIIDKLVNVIFLLIFLALFIQFRKYGSKKLFQEVFLGIVCLELLINGFLVVARSEAAWTETRKTYQAFTSINQRAVDEIRAYDQGFYRITQNNSYNLNDSVINDYYGITYFSTIENDRLRETLNSLGYATAESTSNDFGGTFLTQMLFWQKYEIIANSADYIRGRTNDLWTINDKVLSLGYMAADEIYDTALDSDNAFENLNSLAQNMTGQEIEVFVPYTGEVAGETKNMSVLYNGESYGLVPEEGATEGSVIIRLKDDTQLPAYAYFSQEESVWLGTSFYYESGEDDRARLLVPTSISLPQIIELAKDQEGKYFIGIYFDEEHTNHNFYKESYFYCYDDTAVDEVYEQLKDNQMNILEMKGSDITAEIEVPSDKHILFTSIPYDEGWHVLVDGKEADTLAVVNDTFLAVELTEGHHELKFYYDSTVNRIGVALSIVGVIIYIGMIMVEKKWLNKKENGIGG